ncbi:MAG TPA: LuxR C-terminal-related transcriptional regulator [Propionibacteriaceae bacterium]|nr:LuxR C-terminal-related transcriptional regulator [Propionibacteriaceae bacterium]
MLMYSALRAVKVTPPQLPLRVVTRPRLLEMLDRSIERPVTLISAGPGSGKTVLVNEWARARTHRLVWVSLDPEDDRAERFWTLVQFALQHNGLVASVPGADTGRSMVERAIDELADAASSEDGALVVVLDDVHFLNDADVIGTLDAVLKHPPPGLRVIMTALSDPVIPLHRYRIQGNLSEIRAAELAMSMPEVEQLLAAHDIHLPKPQIESLAERTEGWVAGVRLSAMRIEGSPDPERFVNDFAMDRGSIGEYLMEEVLANQPPEVQKLLIRSSICDPISGPLADAICESDSASSILRGLAARNAFVMAVDNEGARYRYHPLLREVLRHLLLGEQAAVQRRGHENAARWHEANGNLVEALQHALAAQDWLFCTDLLIRGAFEELYLRATARPISAIGRFVEASPLAEDNGADLMAARAAVSVAIGRHERATALMEEPPPSAPSRGAAPLLAFAQFLVARQAGDMGGLEKASSDLIQQDPLGPFGTFALYEMGSVSLWQGADDLAESTLRQALKQATALSLHAIALRCLGRLAILQCTSGKVSLAEEFLSEGGALLNAHPWIPEEFRVAYHLGGAEVALIRGDLDLYSRFIRLVDADLAPKADPALSCMAALVQAKALQIAARHAETFDVLSANKGRDLASAWNLRSRAEIMLLELEAQMGKPKKAVKRLESLAAASEWTANRALLALARAHLADRDLVAVDRLVRQIVTAAHAAPLLILIEALLLSAEVSDGQGEETTAVEAATRAVQLASAERIVLPFIATTPRIRGLLHRHPALADLWPAPIEGTPERWARELPANAENKDLAEALTEREESILKWLTTTMTMAEIATELYVSTNTVKTHVAAIYRKLEATNRREAIARGRQLHLI